MIEKYNFRHDLLDEKAISARIRLENPANEAQVWRQKESGILIMLSTAGFEIYPSYDSPTIPIFYEEQAQELAGFLNMHPPYTVIGMPELLQPMFPYLQNDYTYQIAEMASLKKSVEMPDADDIRFAKYEDIRGIYDFLSGIKEFTMPEYEEFEYTVYRRSVKKTGRFCFTLCDGEIGATAASMAESNSAAFLYSVASAEKFRGRGFAKKTVCALCATLQREGKTPYIRYVNPAAKALYMKIGFTRVCDVAIMNPQ
ncbi:MAG: GNAT family N-acetyltransferase [Ruminococcaceae bacterium]|nr:GNAT family N-acetyltransferase [Oscillospiraceae bacterium]